MSTKVLELTRKMQQELPAAWISNLWNKWNQQRQPKLAEWQELRNYVFATDTSTTSNSSLPWKNKTTLPKLCQIRDNLHSNYISALFPNDSWLKWEGYSMDDSIKAKVNAITSYMQNKTRESHFRTEMSKLLLDYIDYGNAFAMVDFVARYKTDVLGQRVPQYIGPVAQRISPMDIVFDPTANSFYDSFKIVRFVKTLGEISKMVEDYPDYARYKEYMEHRKNMTTIVGGIKQEDFNKAVAYTVDGFGSLQEYYQSDYVEILEFYGDYYDVEAGKLHRNKLITVFDRSFVVDEIDIPSWFGIAPIVHVGWRPRPDNVWAMGPLDNLVGMQYRIDHLENLKADAMDLCVHPPLVITGEVEEFEWAPGAEIHVDEGGGVTELGKNLSGVAAANSEISNLQDQMELFAGAPREAMGVRTAGEKTAFEVQTLSNAAGRIFQEKITHFEQELLEPILNHMLEAARRNMNVPDVIRVLDAELGIQSFMEVTKEDITATGVLRPVGARHFAAQSQLMQNLTQLGNSNMFQVLQPHLSSIKLSELVEDVLGLERYKLFSPNVAIEEQKQTQRLANQAGEDLEVEQTTPVTQ